MLSLTLKVWEFNSVPIPALSRESKYHSNTVRQVSWLSRLLAPSHPAFPNSGSTLKAHTVLTARDYSCASAHDLHMVPY